MSHTEFTENSIEIGLQPIIPAEPDSTAQFDNNGNTHTVTREIGDTWAGMRVDTVGSNLQNDVPSGMQVNMAANQLPPVDDSLGFSAIGKVGAEVTNEIHAQLEQTGPQHQPQPFQL